MKLGDFDFTHAALFFREDELKQMRIQDFITHREMFKRLADFANLEMRNHVASGILSVAAVGGQQSIAVDVSTPIFRYGCANNCLRFASIYTGVIEEFNRAIDGGGNSSPAQPAN